MKNDLTWFPFYASDWTSDPWVLLAANRQLGWYTRLLAYCWQERGLPIEEHRLMLLAGVFRDQQGPGSSGCTPNETDLMFDQHWSEVYAKFDLNVDGKLWNKKLYETFLDQKHKHEVAVKNGLRSAEVRLEAKSKGGSSFACSKTSKRLQHRASESVSSSQSLSSEGVQGKPERVQTVVPEAIEFREDEPCHWAERLYGRHPKKKNLVLVQAQVFSIWEHCESPPLELFAEIDRVHQLWCEHEDWRKDNARYCPSLDRWLQDRGWRQEPRGMFDD